MYRLIFILAVLCIVSPVLSDESDDFQLLFLSKNAYEDELYDVTENQLNRFLTLYPDSKYVDEAILFLGKTNFLQNEHESAKKFFSDLYSDGEPRFREEALYYLVEISLKQKDYKKCGEHCSLFIEQYPQSAFMVYVIYAEGASAYYLKDFVVARKVFAELSNKFPKDQLATVSEFFIAKSLFESGQYDQSAEKLQLFIDNYPDSNLINDAIFWLAESFYQLKNFNKSAVSFEYLKKKGVENDWMDVAVYHLGRSLIEIGESKSAAKLFEDWLEAYPESYLMGDVLFDLANIYYRDGNYKPCGQAASRILDGNFRLDNISFVWYLKAKAALELGEYDLSERSFMSVLQHSPDENLLGSVYFGLGCCKYRRNLFEESILFFQQGILKTTDNEIKSKCSISIGDAYFELKNYEIAIESYRKVLEFLIKSSVSDRTLFQIGRSQFYLFRFDEAIDSFMRVVNDYPETELKDSVQYAIGWTHFSAGDNKKALEVFERLITDYPQSDTREYALLYAGICSYNEGEYEKALAFYNNMSDSYPDSDLMDRCEYEKGWCYFQTGNDQKALALFRELLESYPKSELGAEILFWMGEYHYNRLSFDESYNCFVELSYKYPESKLHPKSLFWAGRSAYLNENYDKSKNLFESFIDKFPDDDLHVDAKVIIGEIYFAEKKYQMVVSEMESILTKYPQTFLSDDIYLLKGSALYEQKLYQKAIDAFMHVTKSIDKSFVAKAWYYIGKSYMSINMKKRGIESLLRVVYQYCDQRIWFYRACFDVAVYYDQRKKWREAKNLYSKMLDAYPDRKVLPELLENAQNRLKIIKEKQFISF